MKNEDIEREAKKLIQRYGRNALVRATSRADEARSEAQERFWEAVEETVMTMLEG